MNMDPVCGMEVKPETARFIKYHEQDWFFCSEKCQHKFEDNPQQYTVDPVCVRCLLNQHQRSVLNMPI